MSIFQAPPGLRAAIYLRNSKGKRGTSTRDQEIEDRRVCDRYGWSVAGVFEDRGISASRSGRQVRKSYEEMLAAIRTGQCDVVVYWEASRGYRTLDDYVELRNLCEVNNVLICYNGRIFDMSKSEDRHATGRDALDAEGEADKIRERNRRTKRLSAERGAPDGRLPYGYRREYGPETGHLLRQVQREDQAPVVAEIFERIAAGGSVYSIAADLNRRGAPAPGKAGEWLDTHVTRIAKNPAYIGKRKHQGAVVGDALWPRIVGDEVFYACAKIFSDPDRPSREGAVVHLLSGIPLCGNCHPRVARIESGQSAYLASGERRRIYLCKRCRGVSIGEVPFDEIVELALLTYVEREEFAASLLAPAAEDGAALAALAEAQALEVQLADARVLAATVVDGRLGLSVASLAALESRLVPMIEAARARAQDATVPGVLLDLAGPGARDRWERLDLHARRAAIRALFTITLYPAGRGAQRIVPSRYRIEPLR